MSYYLLNSTSILIVVAYGCCIVVAQQQTSGDAVKSSSFDEMGAQQSGMFNVNSNSRNEKISIGNKKTTNYNYNNHHFKPTQLTQLVLNVPPPLPPAAPSMELKNTRKKRLPTEEEMEIKEKILELFNKAKNEKDGDLHMNHLGKVLKALNAKYIATQPVRRIVFADPKQLQKMPASFASGSGLSSSTMSAIESSELERELSPEEKLREETERVQSQLDDLLKKFAQEIQFTPEFLNKLAQADESQMTVPQLAFKRVINCVTNPTECTTDLLCGTTTTTTTTTTSGEQTANNDYQSPDLDNYFNQDNQQDMYQQYNQDEQQQQQQFGEPADNLEQFTDESADELVGQNELEQQQLNRYSNNPYNVDYSMYSQQPQTLDSNDDSGDYQDYQDYQDGNNNSNNNNNYEEEDEYDYAPDGGQEELVQSIYPVSANDMDQRRQPFNQMYPQHSRVEPTSALVVPTQRQVGPSSPVQPPNRMNQPFNANRLNNRENNLLQQQVEQFGNQAQLNSQNSQAPQRPQAPKAPVAPQKPVSTLPTMNKPPTSMQPNLVPSRGLPINGPNSNNSFQPQTQSIPASQSNKPRQQQVLQQQQPTTTTARQLSQGQSQPASKILPGFLKTSTTSSPQASVAQQQQQPNSRPLVNNSPPLSSGPPVPGPTLPTRPAGIARS